MKKDWIYILSPCIIAAVFALLIIISGILHIRVTHGWSTYIVIIGFPFFLVMIIVDLLLKWWIKRTGLLWLVELIIVGISFCILNNYMS